MRHEMRLPSTKTTRTSAGIGATIFWADWVKGEQTDFHQCRHRSGRYSGIYEAISDVLSATFRDQHQGC